MLFEHNVRTLQTDGQTNKPVSVEELARALPSFKRPLLSVDVRELARVIASNDIL